MEFERFVILLEARLKEPLPGRQAQLKMSSLARLRELEDHFSTSDAIQSGVLILLYPVSGQTRLVLMLRPEYAGVHSGQISLPGGKFEEGDDSLVHTALREAQEEIGADPCQIRILGQLTGLYIPPSNFMVTPVVGYQESRPEFKADPKEVAKIIELDMEDLLDQRNMMVKTITVRSGLTLQAPSFCIEGNIIWGATAMILSELREIVAGIIAPIAEFLYQEEFLEG